jgi:hypothetical protein
MCGCFDLCVLLGIVKKCLMGQPDFNDMRTHLKQHLYISYDGDRCRNSFSKNRGCLQSLKQILIIFRNKTTIIIIKNDLLLRVLENVWP